MLAVDVKVIVISKVVHRFTVFKSVLILWVSDKKMKKLNILSMNYSIVIVLVKLINFFSQLVGCIIETTCIIHVASIIYNWRQTVI